ncbi:MAG: energy-coupling factor transporter transmembrane protein EcfT [Firmicutes bacterium]|nr:energy-coupling factor transporter transmembrane protein EcfT [Bacillota bacterium]
MESVAYYPAASYWHRRDPRLKLLVVLAGATLVFTERSLGGQLLLFLLHILLFYTGRLPLGRVWWIVKAFRWLFLITFLLNLGAGNLGGTARNLLRLLNFLLLSSWLLGVTENLTLIEGLDLSLKPLRRWLPAGEIAVGFGLTLSFFPLFLAEAREIILAQRARGVNFKTSWIKKLRGLLAMVIPLFMSTFRRALAIAQAMEARGYVPGAPRGSLYELVWDKQDTVAAGLVLGFVLFWWGAKLFW